MAKKHSADDAADAMLIASRALLGVVARSVAPALEAVSLPQFRVLVQLSSTGHVRMGALADSLGINVSTFSRSIDRLVVGGWVERIENPESRREVLLDLTDDGRRLVESVTARRRREIAAILTHMDAASTRSWRPRSRRSTRPPANRRSKNLLILGM